jgi:non-haem Fe2+, alpha-ketoglutarate-dependent halogenase
MAIVWLIKPFKSLHSKLPPRLGNLVRAWDSKMIWTFILSFGKRVYPDQNCTLKDPPSFQPLIKTRPEWQFSEQEIKSFYDNGFIGPITLWSPEEMGEIRRKLENVLNRKSMVYPGAENQLRDRYIDAPEYWELISVPQLAERMAQIMGPDLLVWRTQIFNKMPGGQEITWHQASTYMSEQRIKATLEPPNLNEMFELSAWIAIDDAFPGNGCMHFLKGTNRKIFTMFKGGKGFVGNPPELAKQIGGYGRFAKLGGVTLECPITEDMIVPMPLKAGQCVLFTERCIHGSPPNTSDKRRFGLTCRVIKPSTQAYRDEKVHAVTYLNETFDLKNWGCAVLRGEDKYHLNPLVKPPVHTEKAIGQPA